ncbi:DUF4178 domain-containing protein [Paenibacillus mucilaginosus]|uniref:Group-specific protein n=1 Tax=Paenibacillus mucilaginosus (strain KNP414) TaxID=1036673 RepID=F8FNQ8_PAEMK|nr:DUF4178 domain-containing protein [Paenibacillus mucilaginosus]AEI40170.1 group-specific protein [Paenibacillus mucilaginosus KNP414]MCG7215772.1 DUF4178 domain-containing protein [Paenibacillus mucilaginosus]WDM29399.1 DUF4178 domain-containing protein [Paenibacillus mucilaginosus]
MSIWKRVGSILKSGKEMPPERPSNPFEDTRVGDILTVDLEEYVVSGKAVYYDQGFPPHRFAYYLQNGKHISCLLIEKGRSYDCFLCEFVEGALDDPNDVPTVLDVGGEVTYDLEHHRSDQVRTEGQTDFRSNDTVLFWSYLAGGDRHFFLQWQDGKYVALEGRRTPGSQIRFMKGS